jgi:hypothetical protein
MAPPVIIREHDIQVNLRGMIELGRIREEGGLACPNEGLHLGLFMGLVL